MRTRDSVGVFLGERAGKPELLDDDVVPAVMHHAFVRLVDVTWDDHEMRRLGPHPLVLVQGQRHPLDALDEAALADELRGLVGATTKSLLQLDDALVDLAKQILVLRCPGGRRHAPQYRGSPSETQPGALGEREAWNKTRVNDDARVARIAENEVMFRTANESLRAVFEHAEEAQQPFPFLCECGDSHCTVLVLLSLDVYADLREHPDRFVIAPGHKQLDTERVLDETDAYQLIEKTGTAGEIARARWSPTLLANGG